jgi:hypothetical protein
MTLQKHYRNNGAVGALIIEDRLNVFLIKYEQQHIRM